MMLRVFSALLLIATSALAGQQFTQSPLADKLDELRHQAEANFQRLDGVLANLKEREANKKPNERESERIARREENEQYWVQHNYWFHYLSAVEELRSAAFRHMDGPTAAARLAAARKYETDHRLHIEVSANGSIAYRGYLGQYQDKKDALKNAAGMAVYLQLLSYDLKTGEVKTADGGEIVKPAELVK